jgi:hypothetical protein
MNEIRGNQNLSFQGSLTRKLLSNELSRIKKIDNDYNFVSNYIRGFNGRDNIKFRQHFSDLYKGKQGKGFVFHSGDDVNSPLYHIFKFSQDRPMNIRFINGDDVVACKFEGDNLTLSAADDVEKKYGFDKIFDKVLGVVEREMELLRAYSEYYPKIKSKLGFGELKSTIVNLIEAAKDALISGNIKGEIQQVMGDYEKLNKVLNNDFKHYSFRLKEAYFGKDVQKKGKELTFSTNDGFIKFCPLRTNDDRVFRLWKFDNQNDLKYAVVSFSDGSLAIPKEMEKFQDIRPYNLVKITDKQIEDMGIKEDFNVLSGKFTEFIDFIKDFSSKYKLERGYKEIKSFDEINKIKLEKEEAKLKKRTRAEWFEELRNRKAEKEQARLQKKIQKEQRKAQKLQEQLEAKQKLAEEKAKRRLEKTQNSEKIKIKKVQTNKENTPQKVFNKQGLEGVVLSRLAKEIKAVFDTPIENRSPNILHDTLKDGRPFAGRIYAIADDGTKISITKVKSPRYVEFTYYSIKLEKNGVNTFLNLDMNNGAIILSTVNGQPILAHNQIKHLSKEQMVKITPMTNEIPKYLQILLNVE